MDALAAEDHSYTATKEERKCYNNLLSLSKNNPVNDTAFRLILVFNPRFYFPTVTEYHNSTRMEGRFWSFDYTTLPTYKLQIACHKILARFTNIVHHNVPLIWKRSVAHAFATVRIASLFFAQSYWLWLALVASQGRALERTASGFNGSHVRRCQPHLIKAVKGRSIGPRDGRR